MYNFSYSGDFHIQCFRPHIILHFAQCAGAGRSVWLCVVITWNAAGQSAQATTRGTLLYSLYSGIELEMNLREVWSFTIMDPWLNNLLALSHHGKR